MKVMIKSDNQNEYENKYGVYKPNNSSSMKPLNYSIIKYYIVL